MTEQPITDLSPWQQQLEDLIDGQLEDTAVAALRQQVANDPLRTQELQQAQLLQQQLAALEPQRAPPHLRRKLHSIPNPIGHSVEGLIQRLLATSGGLLSAPARPLWAAALALLVAIFLGIAPWPSQNPNSAEIARGRQDLALALAYLERANQRTALEVQGTLDLHLARPVRREFTDVIDQQLNRVME